MIRWTRTLSLLLCLVALGLSGLAAKAGHARTGGLTELVICAELGPQTIWLDQSGTPTKAPDDCATCAACFGAAPEALTPQAGFAALIARTNTSTTRPALPRRAAVLPAIPPARGPPHAHPDGSRLVSGVVAGAVPGTIPRAKIKDAR